MAGNGVIPPGAGHTLTARGSIMAFKAVAEQTGGDFSLMERTLFILDGQISFTLDGTDLPGGPGDFLLVPRGAAHTFGNAGTGEARLLVLHAPAMDAYFEELHRLWASGQPPATQEERALMARFGMEPA